MKDFSKITREQIKMFILMLVYVLLFLYLPFFAISLSSHEKFNKRHPEMPHLLRCTERELEPR